MKFEPKKLNKEVRKVRGIFAKLHEECGNVYGKGKDKKPYVFHLDLVAKEAFKYKHLIDKTLVNDVLKAVYGHDTLEDCPMSPNDVIDIVGSDNIVPLYGKGLSATIIYMVTDEKGWDRNERSERTYPNMVRLDEAVFVKICDRLANTRFSKIEYEKNNKNTMYKKYCNELDYFFKCLYVENSPYSEMWKELFELCGREYHKPVPKKETFFTKLKNSLNMFNSSPKV